jgi:hypothetical protein
MFTISDILILLAEAISVARPSYQILLARHPLRGTLQACSIGVLTVYG